MIGRVSQVATTFPMIVSQQMQSLAFASNAQIYVNLPTYLHPGPVQYSGDVKGVLRG